MAQESSTITKEWTRYLQAMSSAERLLGRGTTPEYAYSGAKKALDVWWNKCEKILENNSKALQE